MTVRSIAFIMYPVTDVPRAVAFYTETVGLSQVGHSMPYWVEFEVGGATFGVGNFEQVGTAGSAQSLALEVDDMAASRARLETKGVASSEPFETPICWISGFADPDGNKIWLHQLKASA